ncbi:MAG: hypothetical protein VYD03_05105 [Pseudomonadota bacterium]|nr:hypothetical protein [Pseudomonadota bacterium]
MANNAREIILGSVQQSVHAKGVHMSNAAMPLSDQDLEQIKHHLTDWMDSKPLQSQWVPGPELLERSVRVEEELKHQRLLMRESFEQFEKRFEQRNVSSRSTNALNKLTNASNKSMSALNKSITVWNYSNKKSASSPANKTTFCGAS